MSEAPSVRAGWNASLWFAGITFVFCLALICWLIAHGNGLNPLHQAALHWCFMAVLGVMGGFGVAQIPQHLVPWSKT